MQGVAVDRALPRGSVLRKPAARLTPRSSVIHSSAKENLSTSASITITGMDAPFAQGAFRWVARGHYTSGPRNGQPCVAKWFKTGKVYDATYFSLDIQAVEKAQVGLVHVCVCVGGA